MNTTFITIFICEIIILGLTLYCLIGLNLAVNRLRAQVELQNKQLKTKLSTTREIFTLTHQYIEMWKEDFLKKIEASGNILGEFTVYYLIHKLFKKQYEKFELGFNFAKLFW